MPPPDQALAELAIFPLPDVVLFPGAALPLHVFEPRYVAMTRDVLAGSRLMAIVRLQPGYQADYHGRPPVYRTATVGEVIASEELPEDRFAIIVRGLDRIVIERELPPERSYRRVVARVLADDGADEGALAVERGQLQAMCDQLADRIGEHGERLRELLRAAAGSTGGLTFAVASSLVGDPDQRQSLLELRSPAERLTRLVDHTADLLARLGPPRSPAN
ncbi:MAG TPA: LON peptidase substrate-binding domain-containing protein [Kofleriaceae bacterium]|nr:LON peptidase substrate-binding domain-containing protein [Kofleriaceae bacterium]